MPASTLEAPSCVKLYGLLSAPPRQVLINGPSLTMNRLWLPGVVSAPFGRMVLAVTAGKVSGCSSGRKQSVYRVELLATDRLSKSSKSASLLS
eukprot:2740168-Amphidinium_carterae.1